MPSLQEQLDVLRVEVTSPDNQIKAKISGEADDVALAMRPGAYKRYDEATLEHQLSRLCTLGWTGVRRGYFQALATVYSVTEGEAEKMEKNPPDVRDRDYNKEISEIVAEGRSKGGVVRGRAKGMAFWKVQIRPGTLEKLDEEEFIAECLSALRDVQLDSKRQEILLKDKYFGLNVPMILRVNDDPRKQS
ncbi:MAG TPA: hypothetical protein VE172_16650 [Stackebrandtia sp.]|uniref:hypothetical protein n=1 Tax=Stackebrandtia sp. TaxID=2023065 RepID=UPI002D697018|nr:hypothetical protein [Stackebrandtia sp.]HZE40433.1 hypothetical protein [Stackebrandtia sp.]